MKDADYLAGIAKRTLSGPDMNTTKHTPGPWTAEEDSIGKCWQIWAGGAVIAHAYGKRYPVFGADRPEANARLIAAAPKLLEAIRGLANWTMRDGTPCFCPAGVNEDEPKGEMPMIHSSACEDARAAIAEAEGRE